jgi:hypothetical protein
MTVIPTGHRPPWRLLAREALGLGAQEDRDGLDELADRIMGLVISSGAAGVVLVLGFEPRLCPF